VSTRCNAILVSPHLSAADGQIPPQHLKRMLWQSGQVHSAKRSGAQGPGPDQPKKLASSHHPAPIHNTLTNSSTSNADRLSSVSLSVRPSVRPACQPASLPTKQAKVDRVSACVVSQSVPAPRFALACPTLPSFLADEDSLARSLTRTTEPSLAHLVSPYAHLSPTRALPVA
jgi:hypothetical protein